MSASNNNNIEIDNFDYIDENNDVPIDDIDKTGEITNVENVDEIIAESVETPNYRLNLDTGVKDDKGNTALALACENGYEEIIELLCSTKDPKLALMSRTMMEIHLYCLSVPKIVRIVSIF
jgi:ankyrin repeat protein